MFNYFIIYIQFNYNIKMSSQLKYHVVQPQNSAASYEELDTVSFLIEADGRKMIKNSIRIEGNVVVEKSTATAVTAN